MVETMVVGIRVLSLDAVGVASAESLAQQVGHEIGVVQCSGLEQGQQAWDPAVTKDITGLQAD
jgi:hypothetical protein